MLKVVTETLKLSGARLRAPNTPLLESLTLGEQHLHIYTHSQPSVDFVWIVHAPSHTPSLIHMHISQHIQRQMFMDANHTF